MYCYRRYTLQHRIRASRIIIIALVIALASITLVAAAIYYFYTAQVQVNVETPKVTWVTGSDIAASIGTNKTSCQITIGNLEPNATTCYTNALKFTVNTATVNGMSVQITSVSDTNSIIWGIRLYVFNQSASSSSLTLVDGGNVTIGSTDGNAAVAQVGYRQTGANSAYGSTTTPTGSGNFAATAGQNFIIVVEVMGKDGILSTYAATLTLKLLWS